MQAGPIAGGKRLDDCGRGEERQRQLVPTTERNIALWRPGEELAPEHEAGLPLTRDHRGIGQASQIRRDAARGEALGMQPQIHLVRERRAVDAVAAREGVAELDRIGTTAFETGPAASAVASSRKKSSV